MEDNDNPLVWKRKLSTLDNDNQFQFMPEQLNRVQEKDFNLPLVQNKNLNQKSSMINQNTFNQIQNNDFLSHSNEQIDWVQDDGENHLSIYNLDLNFLNNLTDKESQDDEKINNLTTQEDENVKISEKEEQETV